MLRQIIFRGAFFAVTVSALAVSGCWLQGRVAEEAPVTQQRPHNKAAREVVIRIAREEYSAAVRNIDQLRRLRLVEVVASEEVGRSAFPEYRLFNVDPKSAYSLLGLTDGDILVSANDYVLNDPERFRQYVQVLHREPGETFVEIRRQGEEVVLRFSFI